MSTQRLGRCPPAIRVTVLLALLCTAACASPVRISSERSSAATPAPATSSPSPSALPADPPSQLAGKRPITVTGSVSTSLVSSEGPTTDGVFAGASVAILLHRMQRAGHGFLSCTPRDCWQGRQLPDHSIGVAFQANPLGCEEVQSVRVTSPEQGTVRFDVQARPVCTRGSGAAAKGTAILLAVPRRALPNTGTLTAEVNTATRPSDKYVPLGGAAITL